MKYLFSFSALALLFASSLALAQQSVGEGFTLTNNQSGLQYQCSAGGSNPTPPVDPKCASDLSDFCDRNTSYSSTDCFEKATDACKTGGAKFDACVQQTSVYCNQHTSLSSTQCFDRALDACKGSSLAIQSLIESVNLNKMQK